MNAALNRVSVVILTQDEEVNIGECLASCGWCDDVHVVDSGSRDRTIEIAAACGAHVHAHPFDSFGAQRNWVLDHVPMAHDWVFHLDADERFTPELVAEIARRVSTDPPEAGFYVAEKLIFMGRWLKRAGSYPKYQMRLFHRARMRFRDHGHAQREATDGAVGTLAEPYLHLAFSKGLHDWFEKHNRYSTLEALRIVGMPADAWSVHHLIGRDRVRRRRAWKEASRYLPCRRFARWFATLFVLGGILEGAPARTYARLMAAYEEMIDLKVRLLRNPGTPEARLPADRQSETESLPRN